MVKKIKNIITNISGYIAGFLLAPMTIIAIVQVSSRYIFNSPVTFTEELLRFLLIWSAIFGAVYCFGTKSHLSLGFLQEMCGKRIALILSIFINMLILAFCVLILLSGGFRIVLATVNQLAPTMRIPMSSVYSILPISGFLIVLIITLDTIELLRKFKNINTDGEKL